MLTTDQIYADVQELDARLEGSALGPGDEGWDAARQAWNLAIDQRPAMVVSVRSVADVQAVVDYARTRGLKVAPQGTGHNAAALGSLEHSILLRTNEMRGVEVDVSKRVARVESGAIWLDVTTKTAPHDLIPTLGSAHDVGVAGFTLGGGYCWMSRKHGLSADNTLAIELVTADGEHVRATADENSELFWALRGGGGNFGVVTAFEIKLHHHPEVYATSIMFPIERATEVLNVWREYVDTLTDDTTSYARILQFPPIPDIPEPLRGGRFMNVEIVHIGSEEAGLAVSQPIRDLGPSFEMLDGMQNAESLSYFHMDPPEPVPAVGGAHMLMDGLDAEAIDALVSVGGAESGSPLLLLEIRHLEGALGRVHENAGALGRFHGKFCLFGAAMVMNSDMAVAAESHIEKIEATMAPWDNGARYLNFTEHPSDTRLFYTSETYKRLRDIRAQVDPGELFQGNHPIPPAA
jgi:FAD binding domain/Berberine and berberine like